MIACKVAAEEPCVHLYAQRSLPVLKYSQLLRLFLAHPLQEYMHSRPVVADDLWNITSLHYTVCCKHELDKLTVLAWADIKTTSKTHAELLMQRHSAARTYITIALDCLQLPAVLLLATNRMQRHHLARQCACAVSLACGALCSRKSLT